MLQYNLRSLLAAMLGCAIATWLIFVIPDPAAVLLLTIVMLVVPGMIVAGIVYFRGYRQAFCIGAAPPQFVSGVLLLFLMSSFPYRYGGRSDQYLTFKMLQLGTLAVTLLAGLAGIWIYHLAQSRPAPR